jgi:carbamoyl-phosphate synthase large subunit
MAPARRTRSGIRRDGSPGRVMAFTVLRTAAGSPVAPVVIRTLRDIPDVRVVAVDSDPLSCGFAFADRHYVVPRVRSVGFVEAMVEICRRESVQLLLPDLDEELGLLAEARERFRSVGTRVVVSTCAALAECSDKYRTFQFFRKHGIPTPETCRAEDIPAGPSLGFPVIVKPRSGRGSHDVFKADGPEELDAALRRVPNAVVQEFVDGLEYTIDTMSDLAGNFLYCSVRQRLATDSGISVKGRTVVDAGLAEMAKRIAEALPLVGPGCVQGIEDRAGIKFTEINPRLGGGAALSMAAGAPMLSDLIRLARGEPAMGPVTYRGDVLMLRFWQDVFVDEPTWRRRIGAVR